MVDSVALLIAYATGGVTLLPLLLLAAACHAYFALPAPKPTRSKVDAADADADALKDSAGPHVAAGYFAVCREFVPGGVNGKPPERTTPAGAVMTAESPSVYQAMWKGIFDRGKTQSPSIDPAAPRQARKSPRNVFYVVLRHGHLVLFDNSEQLEIRHVVSLEHHTVDVYAGGEDIPEGELWIKRNCIRLTKRSADNDDSPPYYLFCENCSEKEDFYHAIVSTQQKHIPLGFPTDDMIKLIRHLHASEENTHTRWLNALLGRLFLALYRTADVEQHLRQKITNKISRVAKPAFITNLRLEEVHLGDSGPYFFNPKLREMTVDGTLTLETDVRYMGNFRAVIAAVARIDLGSRFKAREVDMVLAGILKKLEGHMLVKVKPPPSNRIWISFETLPKLDISLEPIVSSRQITYGIILRAIQSRIREVFSETLVYPNWDDMAFTNTEGHHVRGGIWKEDGGIADTQAPHTASTAHEDPDLPADADSYTKDVAEETSIGEATESSLPSTTQTRQNSLTPPTSPSLRPIASPGSRETPHEKPKAMRSNSFASVADPVVSKSPTMTESVRRPTRPGQRDATSAIRTLSKHSPEVSPTIRPVGKRSEVAPHELPAPSIDGGEEEDSTQQDRQSAAFKLRTRGVSMTDPVSAKISSPASEKAKALNQSLNAATAAAKTWGWGMISRQNERPTSEKASLSEPMGRGQPLPPPGVPLPRPERPNNWSVAALNSLRRKPVGQGNAQPAAVGSPGLMASGREGASMDKAERRQGRERKSSGEDEPGSMLTVAAPEDSPTDITKEDHEDEREYPLPDFELGTNGSAEASPRAAGGPHKNSNMHRRSVSHDATFGMGHY